jgi:hypothetical protein
MNSIANQLDAPSPYTTLGPESFKNSRTLTLALDRIYALHTEDAVEIAQRIAFTVKNMSTDYATKLNLLQTAIEHPFFKPASQLRHYCALIALKAQVAVNYVFHLPEHITTNPKSDANHILTSARQDLMKSRNKFILC